MWDYMSSTINEGIHEINKIDDLEKEYIGQWLLDFKDFNFLDAHSYHKIFQKDIYNK